MQNAKARVRPANLRNIPLISVLFLFVAIAAPGQTPATAPATKAPGFYDPLPQDTGEAGLKQELRKLQTTGRLMMVVAHPDDEDGGLLTLEARGKGVQTLLMTLTRGEGGQNKTGDTFSDELGVLRTLELLAADRYYGVEQRFSRVADFGYSKTPEETFQKWGGHDVPLADIVRVIREFRPDVLMARFSGTDRDGHGHHQASAILTKEAFRAAADPNRFPEQIKEGLQPWQAKKLYIGNVCGFGASTCADENYTVKINTGEVDPVLGMSYSQFAIEGLRHQQSQGLGDLSIPSGPRYAFYKLADSTIPKTTDEKGHEKDLFDGIDTSLRGALSTNGTMLAETNVWQRSFEQVQEDIKRATLAVKDNPSGLLESLLDAKKRLYGIGVRFIAVDTFPFLRFNPELSNLIGQKNVQTERAIDLAVEAELRATIETPPGGISALSPGQSVTANIDFNAPSSVKLDRIELELPPHWKSESTSKLENANGVWRRAFRITVPSNSSVTKPYWHRANPQADSINTIDDQNYVTLPFTPFSALARATYTIQGQQIAVSAVLKQTAKVSGGLEVGRPVAVVPAFSVSLNPAQEALPLFDGKETILKVHVSSNLDGAPSGTLHLDLPEGWSADPSTLNVSLSKRGDTQDYSFDVVPTKLAEGHTEIHAILDAGGQKYSEGYTLVTREDLGAFYYFEPAVQHVSIVDVRVPKDLKVGYIMGAGDDIPNVLQQIGMNVTLIPAEKIASENLARYGTIVLGVRAYDTDKDLVANNKKLLDFVSNGGTLIVQNNNSVGDFNGGHFTPYPANLSRARVSVEEAPVQILDPGNSIFHYPNEISQKDFDGWVQERGLYFMDSWDDHFKPLLSCHDPGESDQKGGMIEAKYGKGTYIYTGYAFFRQLPAGVPGAIRLFVNLVSAGHQQ